MAIGKSPEDDITIAKDDDENDVLDNEDDEDAQAEDVLSLVSSSSKAADVAMSVEAGVGGEYLNSRQVSRSLKYSKNREVGTEEDLLFAFAQRDTTSVEMGASEAALLPAASEAAATFSNLSDP